MTAETKAWEFSWAFVLSACTIYAHFAIMSAKGTRDGFSRFI